MNRGAWQAIVYSGKEMETPEQTQATQYTKVLIIIMYRGFNDKGLSQCNLQVYILQTNTKLACISSTRNKWQEGKTFSEMCKWFKEN